MSRMIYRGLGIILLLSLAPRSVSAQEPGSPPDPLQFTLRLAPGQPAEFLATRGDRVRVQFEAVGREEDRVPLTEIAFGCSTSGSSVPLRTLCVGSNGGTALWALDLVVDDGNSQITIADASGNSGSALSFIVSGGPPSLRVLDAEPTYQVRLHNQVSPAVEVLAFDGSPIIANLTYQVGTGEGFDFVEVPEAGFWLRQEFWPLRLGEWTLRISLAEFPDVVRDLPLAVSNSQTTTVFVLREGSWVGEVWTIPTFIAVADQVECPPDAPPYLPVTYRYGAVGDLFAPFGEVWTQVSPCLGVGDDPASAMPIDETSGTMVGSQLNPARAARAPFGDAMPFRIEAISASTQDAEFNLISGAAMEGLGSMAYMHFAQPRPTEVRFLDAQTLTPVQYLPNVLLSETAASALAEAPALVIECRTAKGAAPAFLTSDGGTASITQVQLALLPSAEQPDAPGWPPLQQSVPLTLVADAGGPNYDVWRSPPILTAIESLPQCPTGLPGEMVAQRVGVAPRNVSYTIGNLSGLLPPPLRLVGIERIAGQEAESRTSAEPLAAGWVAAAAEEGPEILAIGPGVDVPEPAPGQGDADAGGTPPYANGTDVVNWRVNLPAGSAIPGAGGNPLLYNVALAEASRRGDVTARYRVEKWMRPVDGQNRPEAWVDPLAWAGGTEDSVATFVGGIVSLRLLPFQAATDANAPDNYRDFALRVGPLGASTWSDVRYFRLLRYDDDLKFGVKYWVPPGYAAEKEAIFAKLELMRHRANEILGEQAGIQLEQLGMGVLGAEAPMIADVRNWAEDKKFLIDSFGNPLATGETTLQPSNLQDLETDPEWSSPAGRHYHNWRRTVHVVVVESIWDSTTQRRPHMNTMRFDLSPSAQGGIPTGARVTLASRYTLDEFPIATAPGEPVLRPIYREALAHEMVHAMGSIANEANRILGHVPAGRDGDGRSLRENLMYGFLDYSPGSQKLLDGHFAFRLQDYLRVGSSTQNPDIRHQVEFSRRSLGW